MADEISIDFEAVYKNIESIVKHIDGLGAQLDGSEGTSEAATADFYRSLQSSASVLTSSAKLSRTKLANTAEQLRGVVADFVSAGESVDDDSRALLAALETLAAPAAGTNSGGDSSKVGIG